MPAVSIIVPSYNRAKFIEKCIKSILNQTFQDFEIIIVDDCSEDNTIEIVKSFNDNRIIYLKNEKNSGAQASRNNGIKNARGKFIGFLDSDDEFLPTKLEKQFNMLINSSDNIGLVHCDCYQYIKEKDEMKRYNIPKFRGNAYKELLTRPTVLFQGMLVKKEYLEKIGYLDETILGLQEWDTSIRLAKVCEFEFLDEPLFIYNIHDGPSIAKNNEKNYNVYLFIVDKHMHEIKRICGLQAVAKHYDFVSEWACRENDVGNARKFLLTAISIYPLNIRLLVKFGLLSLNKVFYEKALNLYRIVKPK